jgi:hypothetical protein
MSAYTLLLEQVVEMESSSLWRKRLGVTVMGRTLLVTSLESGAGGMSS